MKKGFWFTISVLILALDQLTKYLAATHLTAYQPTKLLPMLNFTLAYNTGVAFSFLSGVGDWHRWFFAGFSIVMSCILAVWLIKLPKKAILQSLAVSLILGGAVGNLFDRAFLGHVIDFIELYYQNYHWPVFNLADTAICLGAFLLVIDLCINRN